MDCIDQNVMANVRNRTKPTESQKERVREVAKQIEERDRKRKQRKYLLELKRARGERLK